MRGISGLGNSKKMTSISVASVVSPGRSKAIKESMAVEESMVEIDEEKQDNQQNQENQEESMEVKTNVEKEEEALADVAVGWMRKMSIRGQSRPGWPEVVSWSCSRNWPLENGSTSKNCSTRSKASSNCSTNSSS